MVTGEQSRHAAFDAFNIFGFSFTLLCVVCRTFVGRLVAAFGTEYTFSPLLSSFEKASSEPVCSATSLQVLQVLHVQVYCQTRFYVACFYRLDSVPGNLA